jgi:hypothetical protein
LVYPQDKRSTRRSCANVDSGIEKVGQIHVDFTRMDKSKMPQRRGGIFGKRMFNIPFSVIIEFGSRTGILEFKTAFGGVVFGAASMSFE